MQYNPPLGSSDPDASFINGDPVNGIEGSPHPAAASEYPQREIVNVITAAGLVPSNSDLTQLTQAILLMLAPFATTEETQAGLSTTKVVSPKALSASMLGGVGQAWQIVTASRALETTYYNTTGRPIFVIFEAHANSTASFWFSITINNVLVVRDNPYTVVAGQYSSIAAVVPPGASYLFSATNAVLSRITELR